MTCEYLADDVLDTDRWATDATVLAMPPKVLCRDDCLGLCAECGANLNDGPHEHEAPADPRWEELRRPAVGRTAGARPLRRPARTVRYAAAPMAVPKKKTSKSRRDRRRAQHGVEAAQTTACSTCHSPKLPHRVCPVCGTYRGREYPAAANA